MRVSGNTRRRHECEAVTCWVEKLRVKDRGVIAGVAGIIHFAEDEDLAIRERDAIAKSRA